MEEQLLNLYNDLGIINYTFLIGLAAILLSTLYDLIIKGTEYLFQRSLYYYDKRKELKKNG